MKLTRPTFKAIFQLSLIVALCASLFFTGAFGHVFKFTAAWLKDDSPVINTFTGSNLTVSMSANQTLTILPGAEIALSAQPLITVAKGSESCYVFIKLVESDGFSDFVDIEKVVNTGASMWSLVNGQTNYYVQTRGTEGEVFADNQNLTILPTKSGTDIFGNDMSKGYVTARLTKKDGTDITTDSFTNVTPSLTFKVCCIQQSGLTQAQAFAVAQPILDQ